jgi:perosamine synthetase
MIPLFKVHMPPREHLMPQLEKTLYSGYVTQGEQVDKFERALALRFGTPNVLTVNSGTSALQLALRLAEVRGGEVITSPMTCAATALPILHEQAFPVWADVDRDSGNIDPDDVMRKITLSTRAILAVNWGGQPCDMDRLMSIGQHYDIPVIVDAAHSLGAKWDGKDIATVADYTCYSLQAIKHITTGDGGILVCKDPDSYERGKRLRWFGIDRTANTGDARVDADIREPGYKFHMNDIAATIGLAQLKYLDFILARHRRNAAEYESWIPVPHQDFPVKATGSWWLYTLLLESGDERENFQNYMVGQGIQVSRVHGRLDHMTCFNSAKWGVLPGVASFFDRECCIPVHAGLTNDQRNYIIESVNEFL